jgi:hypothetical protein
MTDSDDTKPLADVVEQNQQVSTDAEEDSHEPELPDELPLEADPADLAEQAREVSLDEDDYR